MLVCDIKFSTSDDFKIFLELASTLPVVSKKYTKLIKRNFDQ